MTTPDVRLTGDEMTRDEAEQFGRDWHEAKESSSFGPLDWALKATRKLLARREAANRAPDGTPITELQREGREMALAAEHDRGVRAGFKSLAAGIAKELNLTLDPDCENEECAIVCAVNAELELPVESRGDLRVALEALDRVLRDAPSHENLTTVWDRWTETVEIARKAKLHLDDVLSRKKVGV